MANTSPTRTASFVGIHQLAHGLRLFAENPDHWRALADDPSLAKAAADEVLRFEPVGPFPVRIVREAFTYCYIEFPVGSVVPVCTWTANREAPGDAAPMVFDITARGKDRALSLDALDDEKPGAWRDSVPRTRCPTCLPMSVASNISSSTGPAVREPRSRQRLAE